MKVGIVPYLKELARRFDEVARASSDSKARFALEGMSIEIANKAFGLEEAFTFAERPRRAPPAHE